MPHLSTPLRGASRLRRAIAPTIAMATLALLGGCSIWPKALSFQSEPLPAQEQSPQGELPSVAMAASPPAPSKAEVQAAPVAEPLKVEVRAPEKVQPVTLPAMPPAAAPQMVPTLAPAPAPAPVPAAFAAPMTAAVLGHGFYIKVGLFAVPANGANAVQKLKAAGLPAFADGAKSKKGQLTRVQVGPFTTRAKAEAAAKRVRALKLEALVFRHG